jgi:hypothetical protein
MKRSVVPAAAVGDARAPSPPFRFYDNRQKYLAFVNTCNEKSVIARRAADELRLVRPSPPALRIFDAGMGDGTVLAGLMRATHRVHPTVPLLVVAKEISLEDVRLGLEKMPDRFYEHPPRCRGRTSPIRRAKAVPATRAGAGAQLAGRRLTGKSSYDYASRSRTRARSRTAGRPRRAQRPNPVYERPSVLVLYREDHRFARRRDTAAWPSFECYDLGRTRRRRGRWRRSWRRRLAPPRAPGARALLAIQSYGRDAGLEIVQRLWPGENPFRVNRHELLAALRAELGRDARNFTLTARPDDKSVFRYHMHTLPSEIGDRIGTSTLFAAWNAAIYVNQIEDERLDAAVASNAYLEATQAVLQKHGGLWFNDEAFVVTRRA